MNNFIDKDKTTFVFDLNDFSVKSKSSMSTKEVSIPIRFAQLRKNLLVPPYTSSTVRI